MHGNNNKAFYGNDQEVKGRMTLDVKHDFVSIQHTLELTYKLTDSSIPRSIYFIPTQQSILYRV